MLRQGVVEIGYAFSTACYIGVVDTIDLSNFNDNGIRTLTLNGRQLNRKRGRTPGNAWQLAGLGEVNMCIALHTSYFVGIVERLHTCSTVVDDLGRGRCHLTGVSFQVFNSSHASCMFIDDIAFEYYLKCQVIPFACHIVPSGAILLAGVDVAAACRRLAGDDNGLTGRRSLSQLKRIAHVEAFGSDGIRLVEHHLMVTTLRGKLLGSYVDGLHFHALDGRQLCRHPSLSIGESVDEGERDAQSLHTHAHQSLVVKTLAEVEGLGLGNAGAYSHGTVATTIDYLRRLPEGNCAHQAHDDK